MSANPEPNDIDLVIMLSVGVEVGELTPIQYNLARRSALRRVLGTDDLDVIVSIEARNRLRRPLSSFGLTGIISKSAALR